MQARSLVLLLVLSSSAIAQKVCEPTPAYSRCELIFELSQEERKANPNPYMTVQISAEIRSPRHRTVALPAFWDGEKMILRFAPTEPGQWDFRVTSNIARYDNKQGQISATASDSPGFLRPANGHHWIWTESRKAHLWMGDTQYELASMEMGAFRTMMDARAGQKFNHVRGYAIGRKDSSARSFRSADEPDPNFYRALDERVAYMNGKGIAFDMILGRDRNHLAEQFPTWQQRDRYIRYMIARYSAFHVTWQIVENFEDYAAGRDLTKEIGSLLKKLDPYQHPRTAQAAVTSSPLMTDGWMDYITYRSSDDELGSIEHQLYGAPFVNSDLGSTDGDTFRHRLWNATMNGQYPTLNSSGAEPGSASARAMTAWFTFMAGNRYWELEPYFDLDGGRAVALPGTEYIVYVEKPSGPIEVRMEKHGYDVRWIDPATGEVTPMKEFKGERFVAEPPDRSHDWVLHLSREGRKESMLNSYKFESQPFLMQEVETGASKVPYEIAEPAGEEISASKAPRYAAKLRRETRGTRSMMYLWTGEVPTEGQGFRVLGTGAQGTFTLSRSLVQNLPAVMNVRLYGMNANGKLYSLDRIYRVAK